MLLELIDGCALAGLPIGQAGRCHEAETSRLGTQEEHLARCRRSATGKEPLTVDF